MKERRLADMTYRESVDTHRTKKKRGRSVYRADDHVPPDAPKDTACPQGRYAAHAMPGEVIPWSLDGQFYADNIRGFPPFPPRRQKRKENRRRAVEDWRRKHKHEEGEQ